jgi:hypothetical protein
MTEILTINVVASLKLINSPRQRRQKLDRKLASVLINIEVIK